MFWTTRRPSYEMWEMTSPTARTEPTALISAVVAMLGVFGWLLVARIIGLPAMTVALVGVGLSAAFFVLVLVVVAWDLIDPVTV